MIAAIFWTGIVLVGAILWFAIRSDDKRIANEPCDEDRHVWTVPPKTLLSSNIDDGHRVCLRCGSPNNNMRILEDDDPRLKYAILKAIHNNACMIRNISIPDDDGTIRTRATGACTCDGRDPWGLPMGLERY